MDRYVYPGTNVLRNLRDIRDAALLNEFEAEASSRRLRQLAIRDGYELDWSRVSQEQMIEASRRSFRRDFLGLEQVLRSALDNVQDATGN